MKYPKIETLYNRNDNFKVTNELRLLEFGLIKRWLVTEKIDGTNVRVMLFPDGHIEHRGRTDSAQFHPNLQSYLSQTFTSEVMQFAFDRDEDDLLPGIILFGEDYGPKIQSGGKYRDDISFCLFDVRVGEWWLNWDNVENVAQKLGVTTVPVLCSTNEGWLPTCKAELEDLFPTWTLQGPPGSLIAEHEGTEPEGIVARTDPLLFTRKGQRLMWKLKFKDFQ